MAINADEVRTMARLARLKIDQADVPAYAEQLSRILEFVARLQAVDTTGIEPMAHPTDMPARLREDVVTESDQREELQDGAPALSDGMYLVPQVIE